jgi:hypothetical protein
VIVRNVGAAGAQGVEQQGVAPQGSLQQGALRNWAAAGETTAAVTAPTNRAMRRVRQTMPSPW